MLSKRLPKTETIDLLAACPTCQGFSSLRRSAKQNRYTDPRNRLIDDVLRIAIDLKPKVLMMENVPGLAIYSRFSSVKRTLRKNGYHISEKVLNVAEYGVPQRRLRLVLLASQLGPISHCCPPNDQTYTVLGTIGNIESKILPDDPLHYLSRRHSERVMRIIKSIPTDSSRSSFSPEITLDCQKSQSGYYDVYGRMKWNDVSTTITCGCINPSKGRFLHLVENKAITLREAALLQTFTPDYMFSLRRGKYALATLIGNALPPLFSKMHAEEIRIHISNYSTEE